MNDLLPKSEGDFSEKFYWENFFKTRSNSFEWYGEYQTLIDLFLKYVQTKDKVLVVGCGNSTLSEDLYITHKCKNVISIDTSNTAIDQMLEKNKKYISALGNCTEVTFDFLCMDASNISCYEKINSVLKLSCIIDKGTTDAIHCGGSSSSGVIEGMWSAIEHSLSIMGRYILITLAQEHIVESIIKYFTNNKKSHGWMINVHELAQSNDSLENFKLPIFAFVFYKMKFSESLPLVYVEENSFSHGRSKVQKKLLKNPKIELSQWIMSRQRLSMLCNTIKKSNRNESEIDMISPYTGLIRYHCIIVHNKITNKRQKNTISIPYCIFIIPFGHETSTLYATEEQRRSMCHDHIKCRQCLFVYLNTREYYASKQVIQDELHSLSLKFCPTDAPKDYSIPVISSSEQICAISITKIDQMILETVNINNGDSKSVRLVDPRSLKSVIMSTSPLCKKDILLEKWISNLCGILSDINRKCLYLGRPSCTRVLNEQWTVASTVDNLKDIMTFSASSFNVCTLNDVSEPNSYSCVICDTTVDQDLCKIVDEVIEKCEILILCSSTDVLSNNLQPLVRYSCMTVESILTESTNFWILSNSNIEINSFDISYKKLLSMSSI